MKPARSKAARAAARALPFALIAIGIALVAWGVARGEVPVLVNSATNICFQCIGIG